MPVVAIGAAIAGWALGGGAALGAVVAGTATLADTLAVTAAVGATVSAVGAVTGDKGLTTAGAILGGIGGIGSLAASAGLLGTDATTVPLFGSSTSAASDGITEPMQTAADSANSAITSDLPTQQDILSSLDPTSAGGSLAAAADGTPLTSDVGSLINGASPGAASNDGLETFGSSTTSPTAGAPGSPNATPPSPVTIAGGTPSSPVAAPSTPGSNAPLAPVTVTPEAPSVTNALNAASPGALDGILNFANKNPVVAMGAVQAAGSFLSGAFNPTTPAQVAALNAQAAENNATAGITNTQGANIQQSLPTATRTPAPTSLINATGA